MLDEDGVPIAAHQHCHNPSMSWSLSAVVSTGWWLKERGLEQLKPVPSGGWERASSVEQRYSPFMSKWAGWDSSHPFRDLDMPHWRWCWGDDAFHLVWEHHRVFQEELGRGMSGISCLSCRNDLIMDKQEIIDGSLNDHYADRDSFRMT